MFHYQPFELYAVYAAQGAALLNAGASHIEKERHALLAQLKKVPKVRRNTYNCDVTSGLSVKGSHLNQCGGSSAII